MEKQVVCKVFDDFVEEPARQEIAKVNELNEGTCSDKKEETSAKDEVVLRVGTFELLSKRRGKFLASNPGTVNVLVSLMKDSTTSGV